MKLIIFASPNQLLDKQELSVVDPSEQRAIFIYHFIIIFSIVPKDFGFQLTILTEYNPQVNILPATTSIFKYVTVRI